MSVFDGTQRQIGKGAQAIVYYYKGFAYKVYNDEYPAEWIHGEILIQTEISKTHLPVVKYYKTEDPHITKMDFIDGITLADRIRNEKYKNGVADIIKLQKEVNTITDVKLPTLKSCAIHDIQHMQIEQKQKDTAYTYLEDIQEKSNLLHLDFHFENIMFSDGKYYIIDWIDARLGNPVYDYAKSYVLMNEFIFRISKKYLSLITKDKDIDTTDLKKAMYVMALLRIRQNSSERTLALIQSIESELISKV